jgi:hypothetical protein
MSRTFRSFLGVAAFVLPAALTAQAVPAPAGASMPAQKNQVLSIQPLSAMFTVYSAEFERRVSPTMTVGFGATHWGGGFDDDEASADAGYTSGDLKVRYYPGAQPFQGFSFGAQAGLTRVTGDVTDNTTGESAEGSTTGPTFGVALDYGWLLGGTKSFYVGLGLGAKMLFIDEDEVDDATLRYPTARISVGYAF